MSAVGSGVGCSAGSVRQRGRFCTFVSRRSHNPTVDQSCSISFGLRSCSISFGLRCGSATAVAALCALLAKMDGTPRLVAWLLCGAGLHLLEGLSLRVKDIDSARHQLIVRSGKGDKDRVTPLPLSVGDDLAAHLDRVKAMHARDLAAGFGRVVLPDALARKYPNAPTEWAWQFVFPAARICRDMKWGPPTRYHLHESVIQRAVKAGVVRAGLNKRASAHTLPAFICPSWATTLGCGAA